MAERSFVEEVKKLRLGAGETFRGEGILAVTKALLESGVAYVAGYQGAPISHLMDVLADAQDILTDYGIRFESSASEATAAATLAASVNYPLRGAVTFKGTVGVNVASDALANLASGGVTGGALVIVGEDYGEGSSIMQERTSRLRDEVADLAARPATEPAVDRRRREDRLRAVRGQPYAGDTAAAHPRLPRARPLRRVGQPGAGVHVAAGAREPAARHQPHRAAAGELPARASRRCASVGRRRCVSSSSDTSTSSSPRAPTTSASSSRAAATTPCCACSSGSGLPTCTAIRSVPLYVMNVAYPVIDAEVLRFCAGKRAVLMVEEGQPNFIEQNIATILRRAGLMTALHGKDLLPMAGEYTAAEVLKGTRAFLERYGRLQRAAPAAEFAQGDRAEGREAAGRERARAAAGILYRLPRAADLQRDEAGRARARPASCLGRHRLPSVLDPAAVQPRQHHDGLRPRRRRRRGLNVPAGKRAISVMGDGGFWHNGLTSGIANAVFNKSDNLTIVVDNNYTSATGGQDILSSKAHNATRSTGHEIEQAVRGVGVRWVKTLRDTYDIAGMAAALKEALTTNEKGPKVLIAQSECMLNKQRREKPLVKQAVAEGKRVVRERFGVDADTCTGDHSCIRLNGCPSLSIKPNPDPLRQDPVATVLDSCVGCGVCGEVAHAAVLCPSFYKAQIINNPTRWDRLRERVRSAVIGRLQAREAQRRERHAF